MESFVDVKFRDAPSTMRMCERMWTDGRTRSTARAAAGASPI